MVADEVECGGAYGRACGLMNERRPCFRGAAFRRRRNKSAPSMKTASLNPLAAALLLPSRPTSVVYTALQSLLSVQPAVLRLSAADCRLTYKLRDWTAGRVCKQTRRTMPFFRGHLKVLRYFCPDLKLYINVCRTLFNAQVFTSWLKFVRPSVRDIVELYLNDCTYCQT